MNRWNEKNINLHHHSTLIAALMTAGIWLSSCAVPISYHDVTTYKNLTDLKAEALMLNKSLSRSRSEVVRI